MSISGYGDWVDQFMEAVEIDEPALVIGHSFGGGVAIKLAQAHPERVGYLVLLNSVGGVTDRPIWEWAWRFGRELFPTRQGIEIARAMRDDLVDQSHPQSDRARTRRRTRRARPISARARGAARARAARARAHDQERRRDPASRVRGAVQRGRYRRARARGPALVAARRSRFLRRRARQRDRSAREPTSGRARQPPARAQVSDALARTTFPTPALGEAVARRAAALAHERAAVSARGRPRVVPPQARARTRCARSRVRSTDRTRCGSRSWRRDRRGLLADTTGVLARHGLVHHRRVRGTWPKPCLALHALTIENATEIDAAGWEQLGNDLAAMATGGDEVPTVRAFPDGPRSRSTAAGPSARSCVSGRATRSACCRRSAIGSPTTSSASSRCTRRPTAKPRTTSSSSTEVATRPRSSVHSAVADRATCWTRCGTRLACLALYMARSACATSSSGETSSWVQASPRVARSSIVCPATATVPWSAASSRPATSSRVLAAGDPWADDEEFVSAESTHVVVGAKPGPHSPRRGDEDRVAGGVPVLVVDALEVVEVDEDDGEPVAVRRTLRAPRAREVRAWRCG